MLYPLIDYRLLNSYYSIGSHRGLFLVTCLIGTFIGGASCGPDESQRRLLRTPPITQNSKSPGQHLDGTKNNAPGQTHQGAWGDGQGKEGDSQWVSTSGIPDQSSRQNPYQNNKGSGYSLGSNGKGEGTYAPPLAGATNFPGGMMGKSQEKGSTAWSVGQAGKGGRVNQGSGRTSKHKGKAPPTSHAPPSMHFSYSTGACSDQRNHKILIDGEHFYAVHATDQAWAIKKEHHPHHHHIVILNDQPVDASLAFHTRVMVAGQWHRPTKHKIHDSIALKGFSHSSGVDGGVLWQPWGVIKPQQHTITVSRNPSPREITYNTLFDLSVYGACVISYFNGRGQPFSGGVPILVLPEHRATGLYDPGSNS